MNVHLFYSASASAIASIVLNNFPQVRVIMSPLDSEEFVVVRGLLLGLRVVVGRIYTAGDLRRRCNGNSAILRRLEKYLVDPTILQPVKLSCTALHKELFSNITKQGLHRRRSSLRKPLAELIGQLDGACHGVNMSIAI